MIRKAVGIALVLSIVLSGMAFAAGRQQARDGRIVVGLSMVQQDSEWWTTMERFARQAVEAEGWEARTIWAAGDQAKQINDIDDFIVQGVDFIIMGPVQAEGSTVAVDAAHRAGIPVITVGRISNTPNTFGEILADDAEFGRAQMAQIRRDFPNGANIVYLYGPVGASFAHEMWYHGTVPALNANPDMVLLERFQNPSDIISDGLRTAEDAIIRFGDRIDVIAATNDGLALGAIRAVHAAGLQDRIKVYGAGLTMMGIEAIYRGELRYTAIRSQAQNAVRAIEMMHLYLQGQRPYPKRQLIPPVEVTIENVLTVRDPMFGGTVPNPEVWRPSN